MSHSVLWSTYHLKIQTDVGHSVDVLFKTRHFAEPKNELSFTNDQSSANNTYLSRHKNN